MDKKDFPIQARWRVKIVFKSILQGLWPATIVFGMFWFFKNPENSASWVIMWPIIGFILFIIVFPPLVVLWREKKFLYSFDEKFITLHQGIIYKAQRNVPYGVLQQVVIKQDLLDRLFRIASLNLENASEGGGSSMVRQDRRSLSALGFEANRIVIPGLLLDEAELMKKHILEKMKKNGSRSGGL